jgi:putative aldouronate transport system permease protein
MYNAAIYETADVLGTYVFRLGMDPPTNLGLSTAASFFNSVIGFCLVIFANRLSRRLSQSSLW